MTQKKFIQTIWQHYRTHRRSFRWREDTNPYFVAVSEIMLQQTQAPRVVVKFDSFVQRFPTFEVLAKAPLQEVLSEWQGLGYNRRGMNLKKLAEKVMTTHKGVLPKTYEELLDLPSIGPNTAGSILAFAYNIPCPFIETNIRSVFIHFFFTYAAKDSRAEKDTVTVGDKDIMPLVEKTLDRQNPREWYYALMDYGVMLKKLHKNPSRQSKHYKTQSPFKGSNRELRARILKLLIAKPSLTEKDIISSIDDKTRLDSIKINIGNLEKEGFITRKKNRFHISP